MLRRQNNRLLSKEKRRTRDSWDLNELLHPARAFGHPSVVVNDSDLTLNEKRAILASWASDACAEDVAPDSRRAPKLTSITDPALDKQAHELGDRDKRYRWRWWKSRLDRRPPRSCQERYPLN